MITKQAIVQRCDIISQAHQGMRLDQAVSAVFPEYSRAQLQKWIKSGELKLNHKPAKPKDKVKVGDDVMLEATLVDVTHWLPEKMPLNIIYEDQYILVINKPANCVVHPAQGHLTGTLVNALLEHDAALSLLPRAGLIHRLDKDTTGLLVVAKTLEAHTRLIQQMQSREIKRVYSALVNGTPLSGATIDLPMGRHPHQRTKMAVVEEGKPSVTHYKVLEKFERHTLLKVMLETGRTHQIRVHLSHKKMPVFGDVLYGARLTLPHGCDENLRETLTNFKRQALHAAELVFEHPIIDTKTVSCNAPLPSDMAAVLQGLRENKQMQKEKG